MPGLVIGSALSFIGEAEVGATDSGTVTIETDLNSAGVAAGTLNSSASAKSVLGSDGLTTSALNSSASTGVVLTADGLAVVTLLDSYTAAVVLGLAGATSEVFLIEDLGSSVTFKSIYVPVFRRRRRK